MGVRLLRVTFDTDLWRTMRGRDAEFQPVELGEGFFWLARPLPGEYRFEERAGGWSVAPAAARLPRATGERAGETAAAKDFGCY